MVDWISLNSAWSVISFWVIVICLIVIMKDGWNKATKIALIISSVIFLVTISMWAALGGMR